MRLDGRGSSDPDSRPGATEDIVSFTWIENPGHPSQTLLGTGVVLEVMLPVGPHTIGLVVNDPHGATDMDETVVAVKDTRPPVLLVTAGPNLLWPPNHRMVPVRVAWQVSDVCDPGASARLMAIVSSEADDAPGESDGRTTLDVDSADSGAPDTEILLRAERSGDGPGRSYEITYAAIDSSGNETSALTLVSVPHDLGQGAEPLAVRMEPDVVPEMAHLYWNAVADAQSYDVISGNVENLKADTERVRLGRVRVPARLFTGTSWREGATGANPESGRAFFYLVQYRDERGASGFGTESAPLPQEPTSCDGGCPGTETQTTTSSGDPRVR